MKAKSEKGKGKSLETEVLKNQLARALADYDNLRKRVERERQDIEKFVLENSWSNLAELRNPFSKRVAFVKNNSHKPRRKLYGIWIFDLEKGQSFNHIA